MGQDFLDIQYVMDFTFIYSQDNVQGRVADPDPCVFLRVRSDNIAIYHLGGNI